MGWLLSTTLALLVTTGAQTTPELDNEKIITDQNFRKATELSNKLPKTLVVRIRKNTNKVEIYQSKEELPPTVESHKQIAKKKFTEIKFEKAELDRDSSTDSGSWHYYRGYAPYYPSYGYPYPNYWFYPNYVPPLYPSYFYYRPSYYYYGYYYNYQSYFYYPYGPYYYCYYRWYP